MKYPLFFFSFVRRYWLLLIISILVTAAAHSDAITFTIGPVFYIAELAVDSVVTALFCRHLFMRRTLDAYAVDPPQGDSDFVKEWRGLDARTRVILSIVVIVSLFLGACLIASSIAH